MSEEKWCARCKEEFPIAYEPARWHMGQMRKLNKAPKWMQNRLKGQTGDYLCGNCFFDMLDERELNGNEWFERKSKNNKRSRKVDRAEL